MCTLWFSISILLGVYSFLNLGCNLLPKLWEIISHCLFKYCSDASSVSSPSGTFTEYFLDPLPCTRCPIIFYVSSPFLSSSSYLILSKDLSPLSWIFYSLMSYLLFSPNFDLKFQLSYVQFQNFHLVLYLWMCTVNMFLFLYTWLSWSLSANHVIWIPCGSYSMVFSPYFSVCSFCPILIRNWESWT